MKGRTGFDSRKAPVAPLGPKPLDGVAIVLPTFNLSTDPNKTRMVKTLLRKLHPCRISFFRRQRKEREALEKDF